MCRPVRAAEASWATWPSRGVLFSFPFFVCSFSFSFFFSISFLFIFTFVLQIINLAPKLVLILMTLP